MSSTRESLCMCDLCRKRAAAYARIEAFAAIRRAAEVARSVERDIGDQSEWHDYELHSHGDDGWVPMPDVPKQIRRAIRAAIGSEKQS